MSPQLFVGVTLETFNEIRKEADGSGLLTEQQRAYVASLLTTLSLAPVKKLMPPPTPLGRRAFDFVTSTAFELLIGGAVILSLILMALTWYVRLEFQPLAPVTPVAVTSISSSNLSRP